MSMKYLKAALLGALVVLAGCASQPPAAGAADAQAEHVAESWIVKAQQALAAGDVHQAAQDYVTAASKSTQPQIAAQATALAWHAGETGLTEQAAKRWLKLQPHASGPHHFLAVLALQRHDLGAATAQFQTLLQTGDRKNDFAAVTNALMVEGNPYEGFIVMRELESRHADNPEAEYALALLAARADHTRLAREKVEHALALKPRWLKALTLRGQLLIDAGEPEKALAPLRALVESSPDDAGLNVEYAQLLFDAHRPDDARKQLQAVLAKDQQQADALILLALDRLDHNDEASASRYLTLLLESGKKRAHAYYYLGELAAHNKDYPMALDWLRRIDGQDRTTADDLAVAATLAQMNKLDEAQQFLAEVRAHDPQHATALAIGEAQLLASHDEPEAGMTLLDKTIKERPADTRLLYARGMLAEQMGHHQQALTDVKQVVRLEPENTIALNALGYMLVEHTSQYGRARRYIEKALSYAPHNAAIIDSLGWAEFHQGQKQAAVETLQRAHSLDDDPEISAHLVAALRASGNHEKARHVLKQALQKYPNAKSLKRLKSES